MKPVVIRRGHGRVPASAFDLIDQTLFEAAEDAHRPFQFVSLPLVGLIADLDRCLGDLTARDMDAARQGRLGLVLDFSFEAMAHDDQRMDSWHAALARRNIPPHRCILLSQGWRLPSDYQAYCDRRGLTSRLTALPYDYFIKRAALFHGEDGPAVFERRLARFQTRSRMRRRPFLTMNHMPRPHRLALLVRLARHGLLEKGMVSFGGLDRDETPNKSAPSASSLAGFTESWLGAGFESELAHIRALGQMSLPGDALQILPSGAIDGSSLIADNDVPYFDETCFSIVAETEMVHVRHRITEKPLKPLANFQPFVLFGSYQSLDIMRAFGFRRFEPLIDERYDDIVSPQGRFDMAFAQCLRLCRLAEAGTLDLRSVDDTVIHNAEFMLTRFADRYTGDYDVPVIAAMTRIAAAAMTT